MKGMNGITDAHMYGGCIGYSIHTFMKQPKSALNYN